MRPIDADALQERLKKKKPDPAAPRYIEGFNDALLRFKSMVHSAPTVEPERKKGKWRDFQDHGFVICPFCGSAINCDGDKEDLHFCFNCGADMREENR